VEHTITEEVTGIDLVQAQIRIAAGATLKSLGISQDKITLRGVAIQCRITTEDPCDNFRPDTGTITMCARALAVARARRCALGRTRPAKREGVS
jgi:pyruvate carboxylase